uniref:Uncharacterized protein n=1 Tax=Medicago truncatula TaxID=3880 RepID=A7UQT6_MEDTR|nr:hypothetical protein MtrDRAFT_AC151524g6v2 [Medicago truncatula]
MLGATLNTASIRDGCSGDKTTKIDAAMDDGGDTEGDGCDTGVGEEGEERKMKKEKKREAWGSVEFALVLNNK